MKVLLFSGTTEGRSFALFLSRNSVETLVSVATEYGKEVMEEMPFITVRTGRLEGAAMERLMEGFDLVIDATHPYAVEASGNIKAAAGKADKEYIRILREEELTPEKAAITGDLIFDRIADAAEFLKKEEGDIFVATGIRDIKEYAVIPGYKKRITVRTLPSKESRRAVKETGIERVIEGKGPFSLDQNLEAFKESGARFLVTKESGRAGGFREKVEAAHKLGIRILMIRRPEEGDSYTLREAEEYVLNRQKGNG